MPRGDQTGPNGMGPMTGRGAGYCAGYGAPGFMNAGPGYGYGYGRGRGGMGRGMGWGRGRGRGWAPGPVGPVAPVAYPQPTAEQELAALKQQADAMKQGLEDVQARIDQLQKSPEG